MQLRENMIRLGCLLRWLASDYDMAGSMTKKRHDSRVGLMKFLQRRLWSMAFDPSFTASKKNRKLGRSAVQEIDQYSRSKPDFCSMIGAETQSCHALHLNQVSSARYVWFQEGAPC